jgi:DNA repair photolyase
MLAEASSRGIPVYVAVVPFLPFHSLDTLDEIIAKVKPLKPVEIFCEVLNPKGDCIPMVAKALKPKYPSEASVVDRYNDEAWAKWTYQVLKHGVDRYAGNGFVAWPDTGRACEKHLGATDIAFLNRFLPV